MSSIYNHASEDTGSRGIARADNSTYKAFWPEVRGNFFFKHRRVYLDFLRGDRAKILYLTGRPGPRPPFILVGNWRDRRDITAIWHVRALAGDKKKLVMAAARECFNEGTERMITKLLDESEAKEFGQWGFEVACGITMLERQLYTGPPDVEEKDGLKIVTFRKRALDEVLAVDAAAFDDFWRLDGDTVEAIATSCARNVFLLARSGEETLGYAMGGTNGSLGYLQRLGVHAGYQGKGIGEALASGTLRALYRLGASTVLVNTQEGNTAALNLYQGLGFRKMQERRYILQCISRGPDRRK